VESGLHTNQEGEELVSGSEPKLKGTGVYCEWKYDWAEKGDAICNKELSIREVEYCEKHKKLFNGKMLCFGHQDQYLKKFN